MHWPSVLASANPLREGQRFVRPFRKNAGRDLCGRRNGAFYTGPIIRPIENIRRLQALRTARNSIIGCGATTPQDYPEKTGFDRQIEREWVTRRSGAGSLK